MLLKLKPFYKEMILDVVVVIRILEPFLQRQRSLSSSGHQEVGGFCLGNFQGRQKRESGSESVCQLRSQVNAHNATCEIWVQSSNLQWVCLGGFVASLSNRTWEDAGAYNIVIIL